MAENVTDDFCLLPEDKACKVLVVDDEPDICAVLATVLRLEGCETHEATSGPMALERLQADPFDVMILDIQMPDMSGVDVLELVSQRHPELLVVILTGHAALDNAIAAAKSEQVVDYLLKPAKNQEVIEAVLRAARRRKRRVQQKLLDGATQQFFDTLQQSGLSIGVPVGEPELTVEQQAVHDDVLHVRPVRLDRQQRMVTLENRPDQPIELTRGEAEVLISLMDQPNQVLSCRDIVLAAWDYHIDETEAAGIVRPYISRMRRKFAAVRKGPQLIRTVRGSGYLFAAAEE